MSVLIRPIERVDEREHRNSSSATSASSSSETVLKQINSLQEKADKQEEEAEKLRDLAQVIQKLQQALKQAMVDPEAASSGQTVLLGDEIARQTEKFKAGMSKFEEQTYDLITSSDDLGKDENENYSGITNGFSAQAMSILRELQNVDIELMKDTAAIAQLNISLQGAVTKITADTARALGLEDARRDEIEGNQSMCKAVASAASGLSTGLHYKKTMKDMKGLEQTKGHLEAQRTKLGNVPEVDQAHAGRVQRAEVLLNERNAYERGVVPEFPTRKAEFNNPRLTPKERFDLRDGAENEVISHLGPQRLAAKKSFDEQWKGTVEQINTGWSQHSSRAGLINQAEGIATSGYDYYAAGKKAEVDRDKAEEQASQAYAQQTAQMLANMAQETAQKATQLGNAADKIIDADIQALISSRA